MSIFTSACSTQVILTRTYLSNSGLWSENDKFYLLASIGNKIQHSEYISAFLQGSHTERLHILSTFSVFQLYYETKEEIGGELRKEAQEIYISVSRLRCLINIRDLFYHDPHEYFKPVSARMIETGDGALFFFLRRNYFKG